MHTYRFIITVSLLLSTILYGSFGIVPKSHAEIMRVMSKDTTIDDCHGNFVNMEEHRGNTQELSNYYDCCYQSYPTNGTTLPKEYIQSEIKKGDQSQILLFHNVPPSSRILPLSLRICSYHGHAPPFHTYFIGSVIQLK